MNIGIYIYDNAEVLDFSGPFEVFTTAARVAGLDWQVSLISEHGGLVTARGNYLVQSHYSLSAHPPLDVLIVAGGVHNQELTKLDVLAWVRQMSEQATWATSVCTGAFILAKAGVLDGLTVTTHWEDIPALTEHFPALNVVSNQRWVEQGKVITSAGISAGIDMSLHLVSRLESVSLAECTARQMEYEWQGNKQG
ncbi:DJ-1/PfpI family protein [Photobacterium ganghwense]|uniref:DJ-1/PfpI family protein n=1 Tax=Photobacterium ganghwense TaxID=320778 RepID=UPI004055E7FE